MLLRPASVTARRGLRRQVADARLYEAKRLGRDHLVGSPPTWEAAEAVPAGVLTARR